MIVPPEELTGVENIAIEEDRRKIRDYFFAHKIPTFVSEQRVFGTLSRLASFREPISTGPPPGISRARGISATGRYVLTGFLKATVVSLRWTPATSRSCSFGSPGW